MDFTKNLSIKGSEAQKQWPHNHLWMLWFDGKSISNRDSRYISSVFASSIGKVS